jgi:lipid A 4'-phosphatase
MRRLGVSRRFDAAVFLSLGAFLTVLFVETNLDLAVAGFFYKPELLERWPMGQGLILSLPHKIIPAITVLMVLCGCAALVMGVLRRRDEWRRNAIFMLLGMAIGPGLIINAVLKNNWDRPRPRDVVEFGGRQKFTPAPLMGSTGKSFPCGDSSIGFLLSAGWWIWRRSRPRRAIASLIAGLGAGAAIGFARMVAGGHFLSDVVWSAYFTLIVLHVLYHYVLKMDKREMSEA